MKQWLKRILCLLAVCVLFTCSTESYAAKHFEVSVKVNKKENVELSWKKKKVDGYDIYRASYSEYSGEGKYKKIATISGKKRTYTDKKAKHNKRYVYKVKGFKKKSGKKKYTYKSSQSYAYIKPWVGYWEEGLTAGAVTTPDSIELISGSGIGIYPTAYDIYRKNGEDSSWELIATVKGKGEYCKFTYTDNMVQKGETYSYRFRPYVEKKGKKSYGKYSDVVTLTAYNSKAAYQVEALPVANNTTNSIVLKITSNQDNGVTVIPKQSDSFIYEYGVKGKSKKYYDLVAKEYSYDGVNWNVFTQKTISIGENETIYVKLESEDGKNMSYDIKNAKDMKIEWWVQYNNLQYILDIDLIKGTMESRVNGEYYY